MNPAAPVTIARFTATTPAPSPRARAAIDRQRVRPCARSRRATRSSRSCPPCPSPRDAASRPVARALPARAASCSPTASRPSRHALALGEPVDLDRQLAQAVERRAARRCGRATAPPIPSVDEAAPVSVGAPVPRRREHRLERRAEQLAQQMRRPSAMSASCCVAERAGPNSHLRPLGLVVRVRVAVLVEPDEAGRASARARRARRPAAASCQRDRGEVDRRPRAANTSSRPSEPVVAPSPRRRRGRRT